jgi:microcystin-dependent protein
MSILRLLAGQPFLVTGSADGDTSMTTDPTTAPEVPAWLQDSDGNFYRIIGGGARVLDDLTDVTTAGAVDGDLLVKDEAIGQWVPKGSASAPPGMVSQFVGATVPAGWLLCDGAVVSRTTYANLFAVCGVVYGAGDGSTTFNLPNLAGLVPTGVDAAQTEFNVLGKTGGAMTHVLTEAEMPAHNHAPNAHGHDIWAGLIFDPASAFIVNDGGGDVIAGVDNATLFNIDYYFNMGPHMSTHQSAVYATGSGWGHYILQPFICLNFMIKV